MSENRFTKMVQTAREHQAGDDAIATTMLKKRGPKTKGKRSHPDYETVTHYLRRETKQSAQRMLVGSGQDLSDLLEELLSKWVSENS